MDFLVYGIRARNMENQILFSDGTGVIKEKIYFNYDAFKDELGPIDSKELKIFSPDWDKILTSETFLDPFIKRYGFGQIHKFPFACYLEYYRNTQFDSSGKYLLSSIKNFRTIKANSMEYDLLIDELIDMKKKPKQNLKREDLKSKIEFQILDVTGHSVHKLFQEAAYKDIVESELTPNGQKAYSETYFKKIIQYYIHVNNKKVPPEIAKKLKNKKSNKKNYTKEEIEGLRKYLSEDPIFEELRSTGFAEILNKVKEMLSRLRPEEVQELSSLQRIIEKKELDSIVKEAIDSLNEFLVGKKSKKKIEKIQNWIDKIQYYYSQPEFLNYIVLIYINDKFSSKEGSVDQINIGIEMLFRRCYREWAKKIFTELNKSENLTKPERRLFILMHIGTPYLNYRTPIFDPLLLIYLNFKKLTLMTFLFSSILKIHKIEENDIKLMNLQLFLSFLKFYVFWINFIRPKDVERKQNVEYKKRFVRDQYLEDTTWKEMNLDAYKLKEGADETKNSEFEELDFSDIVEESDEVENKLHKNGGFFDRSSHLDDFKAESEITKMHYYTIPVKKPGINLKKAINYNLMEFFFRDIIENYCTTEEQELLRRTIIKKDNLEEIGKELNISKPAVHKKIKKILARLSKKPELKDILTEM